MTFQQAIQSLYDLAITQGTRTSTRRLSALAVYCAEQLETRGLAGAEAEVRIEGGARPKDWDVAWKWAGKYRLVISLKSILQNISGSVPNRIDDVMGETANIQLYSPEIVTGYVMIFNIAEDAPRRDGKTWHDTLVERIKRLAVRKAPYWIPSMFESYAVLRVDFSQRCCFVDNEESLHRMFDELVIEVKRRNPGMLEPI